jgi:hypothetical protein
MARQTPFQTRGHRSNAIGPILVPLAHEGVPDVQGFGQVPDYHAKHIIVACSPPIPLGREAIQRVCADP